MTEIEVLLTAVEARENDVLVIRGYVVNESNPPNELEVWGWQSALTNHFDEDDYLPADDHGNIHLSPKAQARTLSPEEARTYCEGLLMEAAGVPQPRPQPASKAVVGVISQIPFDSAPTVG